MTSAIHSQLTQQERAVLELYHRPTARSMAKAVLISTGYAVGGGIFAISAVVDDEPLYVVVVYGLLVLLLGLRLWRGRKQVGVMPAIIEKYEMTIKMLNTNRTATKTDG